MSDSLTPVLFTPIQMRELEIQNRVMVSPMCQYAATEGSAGSWHHMHLGQFAVSGAGLLCIEMTNVESIGRITPHCMGLYSDHNESSLSQVVNFCKEISDTPIALQLAHAGRKASSTRPWEGRKAILPADGGWQTVAPSAIRLHEEAPPPRELSSVEIAALVKNFAGQWLYLRNLRGVVPDGIVFPEFDENLREAFQSETELFVESLIREDRSVLDLLGADYTFVNERLARHYGIPNVYGPPFRRIPLDAELAERRGGIFGHGSLLTVTSYPNRTSPVLRGKWVLSNVLGTPPPPPPADVPDLPDRGEDGQAATVRDRLATHRESPACSVCHAPMDPLGLALENYDAVGKWRLTGEADLPIDSSGNLPDGTVFEGPSGLRTLLLERKEQFIGTLTEKLLAYAIGRGPQYYDRATVRDIVRSAETDNYRWSSVIVGIVKSAPFRMRRSES